MLAPLTMKLWVILASLNLVWVTMADSVNTISPEARSSPPTLWLLELRKVPRETTPSDHTSRDHDVKIVLDEHSLIVGVTRWTLVFLKGGQQFTSSLDALTETDGIQREFVFKTELVEGANAVLVTAKGRSGSVLATGTAYVQIPDLDSNVAWVGGEYHPSSPSSLRVDPGTLSEVWVSSRVCRREKAPCYFLQKELPEVVSRCLTLSDSLTNVPLVLCDDTVLPFHELYQTPSLYITDDYLLEVSMTLPQDVVLEGREVVAYDPEDPSVVFSPEGFRCNPSAGVGDRGERTCTQRLEMTEAKDAVSVLVVLMYSDGGRLESKLLTYRGQEPRASQTGVIVGSVVGGLVGVVLIAAAVFLLLRWRKNKGKKGSSRRSSAQYAATPTSDPAAA
ncbi:uncharacterized protein LOC125028117 [Penaeus chinensis]|uniref:uncharacterized protein LOC125028117 n=1 Tax=Penaeus chinensis TaxID=139456 RepID=UPI001FB67A24|nr:uncharacterized protein LOC125028117 [Penaeus chinensis]XP_047473414.1 uncharacterized protein LOC125028117 [Penaeus chinensis]